MPTEIVPIISPSVISPASGKAILPVLVEHAGAAARFAWDEFFYAEHHNPHTQQAYMRAVKRFLAWAEGQGGWSCPPSRRAWSANISSAWAARPPSGTLPALAALRGFFDRLVNRHVVVINPAATAKGVKEKMIEGLI